MFTITYLKNKNTIAAKEFRPVLILKLASKSLFRWYADVEGISKPA